MNLCTDSKRTRYITAKEVKVLKLFKSRGKISFRVHILTSCHCRLMRKMQNFASLFTFPSAMRRLCSQESPGKDCDCLAPRGGKAPADLKERALRQKASCPITPEVKKGQS
jgi:hypothetical protein